MGDAKATKWKTRKKSNPPNRFRTGGGGCGWCALLFFPVLLSEEGFCSPSLAFTTFLSTAALDTPAPTLRLRLLAALLCPSLAGLLPPSAFLPPPLPPPPRSLASLCPSAPVPSCFRAVLTSRQWLTWTASAREEKPGRWHTGHRRLTSSHAEDEGPAGGPRNRVRVLAGGTTVAVVVASLFVLPFFFAGWIGGTSSWLELSSMTSISAISLQG